ncbi:MAG TPA: alpha-galactosidase [Mycobacteriales bacterium]|nr:alpha-galactosidase [Mycobacteriales bacterium]
MLVGVVGVALLAGSVPAIAAPTPPDDALHTYRVGSAYVSVAANHAEIGDGLITRTWSIDGGSVETTSLVGPGGRQWATSGPDFTIGVAGVQTSSTDGWALSYVHGFGTGPRVELEFRFTPVDPALPSGITLTRDIFLAPGESTMKIVSTLYSAAVPLRIPSYTLDEVTPRRSGLPQEVIRYREGSDWRNDFRVVSHPKSGFDQEGETLRVGKASGFFLVSQRRGGLASRAQHTAAGADTVGVDWARDLFDAGPLLTDPPNYNTIGNPAYPVPLRGRLVPPASGLYLGTAYTGVYAGPRGEGENSAAAAFVPAFPWHVDRTIGANSFHPWEHGAGMADLNLRKQIDAAAKLGVERYMLDDQWQGGPGGESGDWRFDPQRFPDRNHDGVPDFISYLHHKGMQLGLWMSPVEFNMKSVTYAHHPAWACAPVGDVTAQDPDDAGLGVWDVTNPGFQNYLIHVIGRLVKSYDVREFKFDFMAWLDCPPHDYADYEDAFVSMLKRMENRHPHVTFELDETNDQRLWPFESEARGPSWFDNNHDHHISQVSELLHDLWSAAPWLPTQTLGIGSFDSEAIAEKRTASFLMPLALLSHITFWTDFTKLTASQQRTIRWWNHWYAGHRGGFGTLDYELTTADPASRKNWLVLEPSHDGDAYIFAFRQATRSSTIRVHVQGLDPHAHYVVSDARTERVLAQDAGHALQRGLTIHAPTQYSARVLRLVKVAVPEQ